MAKKGRAPRLDSLGYVLVSVAEGYEGAHLAHAPEMSLLVRGGLVVKKGDGYEITRKGINILHRQYPHLVRESEQLRLKGSFGVERPIPNRGPLRRRTTTKKWIGKAITRPGKLGGAGFLSKSKVAQEQILRGCVAEYGYRSCLGSVMILERIPDIQNRWGTRLAGLRHFLVRNFGGPGSFGPRRNPSGTITVESIKLSPDSREMDREILAALGIKSNPTDFALVPEVSGCPLCAVKSNPAFTKAMANPLYGLTIPQEAVYMHFANLDLPPRQAIRQAKAMSDREAEAFMAHVSRVLGEAPAVRTRPGARGTPKKKAKKKPPRRKKAKKNASAVLRNAMRGT